jgi:transposase InsO family protein
MLREVVAEISKLTRIADVLRAVSSDSGAPGAERKEMSAAARKKISLAQKARWAKSGASEPAVTAKLKRVMSASARRKIAAAQRARWAKVKAQQKKAA